MSKRFKITLQSGKEYYVYATDELQATQVFKKEQAAFYAEKTAVSERVIAKVEESFDCTWETTMEENRIAPGG
jgi:hypothetical protein